MKKIGSILEKINRKYKINLTLSSDDDRALVPFRIPTGIPQLNVISGGGLPAGRIVEVSGEESAGKTTLVTQLISANPGLSVLHDIEATFDKKRAEDVGFDLGRLAYDDQSGDASAETIMDAMVGILDEFEGEVSAEEPVVIFLDSVAALITEQEEDKSTKDAVVAALPRVLSRGLKKVSKQLANTGAALVLVNQLRDKIGTFSPAPGKQQDSVGGRALKFYASIRIFLTVVKKLFRERSVKGAKGTEKFREVEGVRVKARTIKNKCFRPFLETEFCIYFDKRGIVWEEDFFNTLVRYGVLVGEKGKTTYTLNPILKGQSFMDGADPAEYALSMKEWVETMRDSKGCSFIEQAAVFVLAAGNTETKCEEEEEGEEDIKPEDDL
ncbi:MAG: ATPase domain-containing protein [Thermotogota bacterium]